MPRSRSKRSRAPTGGNDKLKGVTGSLPQAAASSKHDEPASTSEKPQPSEADIVLVTEHETYSEAENSPSAAASRPRASGSKANDSASESRSARCLFSELPFEVLDRILSYDALNIRDHCALACVNRTLREAYSSDDLWGTLVSLKHLIYIDSLTSSVEA